MNDEFDWSEKSREKYYQKLEKQLKDMCVSEVIKINRDRFGITGLKEVRVYTIPIFKTGNEKVIKKIMKAKNYVKQMNGNNILFVACFKFEMEEKINENYCNKQL